MKFLIKSKDATKEDFVKILKFLHKNFGSKVRDEIFNIHVLEMPDEINNMNEEEAKKFINEVFDGDTDIMLEIRTCLESHKERIHNIQKYTEQQVLDALFIFTRTKDEIEIMKALLKRFAEIMINKGSWNLEDQDGRRI